MDSAAVDAAGRMPQIVHRLAVPLFQSESVTVQEDENGREKEDLLGEQHLEALRR